MSELDWPKVKENLFNWVRGEIDLGNISVPEEQVIFREQSAPLPPRPCVTLKIISGPRRLGSTDNIKFRQGTDDIWDVGGQRAITLSVQVFGNNLQHGDNAQAIANALNVSLHKMTVTDQLRAGILDGATRKGSIAVWEVGDISDISALEETEFEDRAQFDVILGVVDSVEDQPGVIEEVETTPDISTS